MSEREPADTDADAPGRAGASYAPAWLGWVAVAVTAVLTIVTVILKS